MKDLTQYEKAQSVLKEYNALAKDLIGENEDVKCDECRKECSGRESLKQHLAQAPDHPQEKFSNGYVSKQNLYKDIADETEYDYKTVENLVRIAQLPEELQIFVKTPGRGS